MKFDHNATCFSMKNVVKITKKCLYLDFNNNTQGVPENVDNFSVSDS